MNKNTLVGWIVMAAMIVGFIALVNALEGGHTTNTVSCNYTNTTVTCIRN